MEKVIVSLTIAMQSRSTVHGRQSNKEKNNSEIDNRTIRVVDIVCGPVSGTFLYHTYEYINKGGNITI